MPRLARIGIIRPRSVARTVLGWLLLGLAATAPAAGAERLVEPGGGALARALAAAAPGDSLRLAAGDHRGGLVIDRTLTLSGEPGARIVGPGHGRVLTLDAPDTVVTGLIITGSGLKLETEAVSHPVPWTQVCLMRRA